MNPFLPPDDAPEDRGADRLGLVLEASGLGWWDVDLTTGVVETDARFRVLTGLSPEAVLKVEAGFDLVHPDDVADVSAAFAAALRPDDPQPYEADYRTRQPDGTYRWLHGRGRATFEGEGEARRAVRLTGTLGSLDGRKENEAAVRASEQRYRTLVRSIDAGFCVFEMLFDERGTPVDYCFTEVNPAFERQSGLIDAVGRTARELVPELEAHWFELYGNVALTGEPTRFVQGSVTMGRVFDVYAFRLGSEESREVAVLFTDITAQRTAEETLRDANERISAVLESISEGFFALDREWRFTYANREAEVILNCEPGDLLGRVIWDLYPGLEESEFGDTYRRVLAEQAPASGTAYYPGHDRWYEIRVSPAAEGISVFFSNVTDRVRAEEERAQHEIERERLLLEVDTERRKIESAFAESPGFIAILRGRDLIFEYANSAYYQLIGRRDVLGKPLIEALPEVANQAFPDILRNVLDTGDVFEIPEVAVFVQRRPDAPPEERWIQLRYVPMTESNGSISGIFAHGIDITEMVRSRRLLAARAEETALGSRRKDEFLATLAHELRNPLAPIRLSTELMEYLEPSDPEFEEARVVIQRQVDHMVRLVDDLLDVSRVAQGKIKLQRAVIDLAGVVAAAVETSRPGIESGGHTFMIELPEAPVYVNGDAARLAQVLGNLLNNAAKYTPPGGRIVLSVAREGNRAVMRVRDNGIGIPPEMLPHIFDMFAQVEVHLVQSQGGLGIGLTLCRRLVELHGGTIVARSDGPGEGSEFTVRIAAVDAVGTAPAATPLPVAQGRSRRVLVVDDNSDNAWTLAGLVEAMGHEVQTAPTGIEAISLAIDFRPEVVLLDLGLPDLPGYEVARRLRARPETAGATIVAQTGWGREEDRALGREAGFDAHLVKPLGRADLAALFAGLGSEVSDAAGKE